MDIVFQKIDTEAQTKLVETVYNKILTGERISREEGISLFDVEDLTTLGLLADLVRWKLHPKNEVSYIIDRNINYTNVCTADCKFCAFYRRPGDSEGYTLDKKTIGEKIQETLDLGGTRILLQGGHNPELKIEWYEEMFGWIKSNYNIILHALSPSEIITISKVSRISIPEVISRLKNAGLDSIPGGGAEVLSDRVRTLIAPGKTTSKEWLDVMEEAHRQGLKSTATMMFGHVETVAERIDHMILCRELQDRTGGFYNFIPWTFHRGNTELDFVLLPEREKTSAFEYLKTVAISRIMVDNIDTIQSSWVTQGLKVAQISLRFGANDFGSLMIEENVVSATGLQYNMTLKKMKKAIKSAGFEPIQRSW